MHPECPKCEGQSIRRVARSKSLRDRVMYFFGLFPWECVECQKRFFHRKRYVRSRRHAMGEVYTESKSAPVVKPGAEEGRAS
jgi:hypothetical protein